MKWLYFSVLILFSHTSIASVMNNNHLDSCFIQAGKRYLIAPELLKTI
ncbi:lytic transglycosylase, partial [Escherichia coli]|nr:lytic transglycosylase [Escherichia coli]